MKERRTKTQNLYVSDKREAAAICNEIVLSLCNFLGDRFGDAYEKDTINTLAAFISFDRNIDMQKFHMLICADLDLEALSLEYEEVISLDISTKLQDLSLSGKVQKLAKSPDYSNITIAMARILAAKPHSADVERLISCSNILKSPERSRMTVETENYHLYIHFNMPALDEWNPRPAVLRWIQEKDRRTRECLKASHQTWFRGVFGHASAAEADIDSVTETMSKKNKVF